VNSVSEHVFLRFKSAERTPTVRDPPHSVQGNAGRAERRLTSFDWMSATGGRHDWQRRPPVIRTN